jgi:hypothetical protein
MRPTRTGHGGRGQAAAANVILLALGVLLGIYGALLVPHGPRVGGHVLSVGVLLAVVGNAAAGLLGTRIAGRFGGLTPLIGWLVVALAFSSSRPNGSVILPGSGDLAVPALLFLLLGALAGAVAAALGSARRPALAAPDRPGSPESGGVR